MSRSARVRSDTTADGRLTWGDIISWTYDHALNSRSSTRITKVGKFCTVARHTRKHWRKIGAKQMVWVHFDGNMHRSLVPLDEIVKIA